MKNPGVDRGLIVLVKSSGYLLSRHHDRVGQAKATRQVIGIHAYFSTHKIIFIAQVPDQAHTNTGTVEINALNVSQGRWQSEDDALVICYHPGAIGSCCCSVQGNSRNHVRYSVYVEDERASVNSSGIRRVTRNGD